MVLSFETPFGSTAHSGRPCDCAQYMHARPRLPICGSCNERLVTPEALACCRKMHTNYKGHSFLSRLLLFGLSKTFYKDNSYVMESLMETIAGHFTDLFHHGVVINGKRIYGAVIGTKGDLDFDIIYYNLTRSYSKVMVRARAGHIPARAIRLLGKSRSV